MGGFSFPWWLTGILLPSILLLNGALCVRIIKNRERIIDSDVFSSRSAEGLDNVEFSPSCNGAALSGMQVDAFILMVLPAMLMQFGYDTLWIITGIQLSYLIILFFFAAPLKRSGMQTFSNLLFGRLKNKYISLLFTFIVLTGCLLLTIFELQAAARVLNLFKISNLIGILVVGIISGIFVSIGGIRKITILQIISFILALLCIVVVLFFVMENSSFSWNAEQEKISNRVGFKFDESSKWINKGSLISNGRSLYFKENHRITFVNSGKVRHYFLRNGKLNMVEREINSKEALFIRKGDMVIFLEDSIVKFEQGKSIFNTPESGFNWSLPGSQLFNKYRFPNIYLVSILVAIIMGWAGFPHILGRISLAGDGFKARESVLVLMICMGSIFILIQILATYGISYGMDLFPDGKFEKLLINLPFAVNGRYFISKLLEIFSIATIITGLLASISGILFTMTRYFITNIFMYNPKRTKEIGNGDNLFNFTGWIIALFSIGVAMLLDLAEIEVPVRWSLNLMASIITPVMMYSLWKENLSKAGLLAGMHAGFLLILIAFAADLYFKKELIKIYRYPVPSVLMQDSGYFMEIIKIAIEQPAVFIIPIVILCIFIFSRIEKKGKIERDTTFELIHSPE